jgi:hypothetical protein
LSQIDHLLHTHPALPDDQAQDDAEALRYRLQVRLAAVIREAKGAGRAPLAATAQGLREELTKKSGVAQAERLRLAGLEPVVRTMEEQLGLMPHGAPAWPKWVRYLLYTGPALGILLTLLVILERRRRKKRVTDAAIAALDRAGESS